MPDQPQSFVRRSENGAIPNAVLAELLRAVLERGRPFGFEAPGFSMSPFIQNCDTITLSPLAGASPRPGDVVVFLRPGSGKLVVHRVVSRQGNLFLIQGDNGGEEGDLVAASSILGRVAGVKRDGAPVRLGLGPERRIIAALSRRGLLQPALRRVWPLLRPIVRRLRS
jgi:hypothetical protein